MDLFNDNLDSLSITDIQTFLSLSSPENDRLPEGTRIDYKEHLPSDIAEDIAALANTYGGLILVGIKSKSNPLSKQNIPDAIPGTATLGNDAKARITNKIVSSVRPIPEFEIGVCGTGVPNQMVAVIRVEQGIEPPYESMVGGRYRIPIRTQDSKRQASLAEIERFLSIRGNARKAINETLAKWQSQQQGQDYHRVLIPTSALKLRLDLRFESDFRALLDPTEKALKRNERTGDDYTVFVDGEKTFSVDNAGNLGLAANLVRRGHPGEWMGDLIDDLIFFCQAAYRFFHRHSYHGTLVLAHALSCYSVNFLPNFAVLNGVFKSQAISFPAPKFSQLGPNKQEGFRHIDLMWSDLKNPFEIIAEIMLYQLRQCRQANIDYVKFAEEIRARCPDVSV